ncbi:MAG: hypothetical protein KBT48_02720 [Firmicutes bacterium]|nr:hypothetical protein [Bacillota bacterium]
MKYPFVNNCLEFTKRDADHYIVYNGVTRKKQLISKEFADFIRQFDGYTFPARIFAKAGTRNKKEVARAMDKLIETDWLRDTNYRVEAFPFFMITAWIPKAKGWIQTLSKSLSLLISMIWIPTFFIGFILWKFKPFTYKENPWIILLGLILGYGVGAILHELGHVITAFANKKKVYEVGFGMLGFIPIMYTLIDTKSITARKELRIISGGVKMNLIFAGVLLMLASVQTIFSSLLEVAALANIIYAIMNTTFAYGLDGMKSIQYLMFDRDVSIIKSFIVLAQNGEKRREFIEQYGNTGRLAMFNIVSIVAFQVFYPALYILVLVGAF